MIKLSSLTTEFAEVVVGVFKDGKQIDEFRQDVEFPKSWGFGQRFIWLKSHYSTISKAEGLGLRYKFVML